jgi:hypothetical protein
LGDLKAKIGSKIDPTPKTPLSKLARAMSVAMDTPVAAIKDVGLRSRVCTPFLLRLDITKANRVGWGKFLQNRSKGCRWS